MMGIHVCFHCQRTVDIPRTSVNLLDFNENGTYEDYTEIHNFVPYYMYVQFNRCLYKKQKNKTAINHFKLVGSNRPNKI